MSSRELVNIASLYGKLEIMLQAAKAGETFGAVTHNNPDGDGLAVCLGLRKLFSFKGVTLDIILQGGSLERLSYLDVNEHTIKLTPETEYDNILIIDCHSFDRIDEAGAIVRKAERVLIIDHHVKGEVIDNADYYIDTNASCVGVIVFKLLKDDLIKADQETQKYFAEAIYTSIVNDTNNFLNTNVNKDDYEVSAELLQFGLEPSKIAVALLYEKEAAEWKMIGETLTTIELFVDGKVLFFYTTRESLENNGLDKETTSKMTGHVKGAKGVEIILYYREESETKFKFSIRSDIHNVRQVATAFGGGGHEKASGFTLTGNAKEVVSKVVEEIRTKIYG